MTYDPSPPPRPARPGRNGISRALGGEAIGYRYLQRERAPRNDNGKWQEGNRRRQVQTAIRSGVMPSPPYFRGMPGDFVPYMVKLVMKNWFRNSAQVPQDVLLLCKYPQSPSQSPATMPTATHAIVSSCLSTHCPAASHRDDVDWDWSSEEEDDEADFTSYLTRLSGP